MNFGTLTAMIMPILTKVLGQLLSEDNLAPLKRRLFTFMTDVVQDSETKLDDIMLLPILQKIEEQANGLDLVGMVAPLLQEVVNSVIAGGLIREYGHRLFDLLEDTVMDSRTKIDDYTVLPVLKVMRQALGVPETSTEF